MTRLPPVVIMTMHTLLPFCAMVCVTVLAAMGRISGTDALVVIVAATGIGGTGAAAVTSTFLPGPDRAPAGPGQNTPPGGG